MRHARPAQMTSHHADRAARERLPMQTIHRNLPDVKGKSQSILILSDATDEQAILDALDALPAEYVRKVRIYATTLVEIFAQKM